MAPWGLFKGRTKPKSQPLSDRLLAIATASGALRETHQLTPLGKAGLCFKPAAAPFFGSLEKEVRGLFTYGVKMSGADFAFADDRYGFRWVILKAPSFGALAEGAQAVARLFADAGQRGQLRVAVFPFRGNEGDVYWIFNFQRERFYPFVPLPDEKRDSQRELALASKVKELPMEEHLELWYGLWGVPFDAA